jgi:hypothetical protein
LKKSFRDIVAILIVTLSSSVAVADEPRVFNILDYGAKTWPPEHMHKGNSGYDRRFVTLPVVGELLFPRASS